VSAQVVCSLADVPDVGAVRVEVDGPDGPVPVAVVRDEDGVLHAVSDICSHQNVSLSEGDVDGCEIECWLHGARFDLRTGRPSGLPATRPVPVHTVSTDGEQVLVELTAPTAKES